MKIAQQSKALTMLKSSTWGASCTRARYLYTAVVRPAITYAAPVWYEPEGVLGHRKGLLKEVQQLQNKCVRVVAGAYRATNARVLENETRIMPIDIYMEAQIINAHRGNRPRVDSVVTDACRRIRDRLKGKRGKSGLAKITPRQAKLE